MWRGIGCFLTALCFAIWGNCGIIPHNSLIAGHDIGLAPFLSLPLCVSSRLSSCVLCFSWSDTMAFGVILLISQSPLLFSHRVYLTL